MNERQRLVRILHRTGKSALAMIDKEIRRGGTASDPAVEKVYQDCKASVADLERRLRK